MVAVVRGAIHRLRCGSGIYFAFGIAPQVNAHVVHYLAAGSEGSTFPLPQSYEDTFVIDLAAQPFSDAFLSTVTRMFRASNQKLGTGSGSERHPAANGY